jgi:hypothetical protein
MGLGCDAIASAQIAQRRRDEKLREPTTAVMRRQEPMFWL